MHPYTLFQQLESVGTYMDKEQLSMLVRLYQAQIYRYLRYLGAQSSDAEDLVQDVFVAAYTNERIPDLDNDRIAAAWLRGIARNKFLMFCRTKKRSPIAIDSEFVESAEQVWDEEFLGAGDGFEYLEALRNCLGKLTERHMNILKMRYQETVSRQEMAERLEMSEDGIKSVLRRLREKLSQCIGKKKAQFEL